MQRLPDLVPWLNETNNSVFDWAIQGDELRLTTAIANTGEGALEIRGGDTSNGTQEVFQRIYDDNGGHSDRLAGEFIDHPTHGHIHFEDFAEFRLLAVSADGGVGDIVATGEKVSFCLLDVESYDGSGPAAYRSCGQIQGISAGWADVYDKGLPGQSINIASVPSGTYWLEIEADPLNLLVEADETNNVSRVLVTLDTGTEPVLGDTFEPNDTFATASILAPPEDHLYENLSIHQANNDDFFRITAAEDGTLTFNLAFDHTQGDLDLRVYDATQNQIGLSQSVTNDEEFTVTAQIGDEFFVHVYGYQGATNGNYSLFVDQPAEGHDHGDHEIVVEDVPNETQFLTGDPEHNNVFYVDGNVADYGWGPTEDGLGVVVWGPSGHDILTDYNWLEFRDQVVGLVPDDNGVQDIQNVTQFLNGNGVDDKFIIDGSSSDYNWGPTEDGEGIVVWGPTGFDILTNFAEIVFNDQVIDLINPAPLRVENDPNNSQFLTGTAGDDVFVAGGPSTDFGWGETEDATGYVIWDLNGADFDLLFGFETIEFDDQSVDIG